MDQRPGEPEAPGPDENDLSLEYHSQLGRWGKGFFREPGSIERDHEPRGLCVRPAYFGSRCDEQQWNR